MNNIEFKNIVKNELKNIDFKYIDSIFDLNNKNHKSILKKENTIKFELKPPIEINGKLIDIDFEKNLCKKNFLDIMTEFINKDKCFNDNNIIYIERFQYLVNKVFNVLINLYKEYLKQTTNQDLSDFDILFIYKGGTTMKILFDKYKKIFENFNFFNELTSNFKRSDSDYSIFINPNLRNYNNIYTEINLISARALLLIKKIINDNKNFIIPFNTINKSDILNLIIKMNDKLVDIKKQELCSNFNNVESIIGISYFDKTLFLTENLTNLNINNIDNFDDRVTNNNINEFIQKKHVNPSKNDFFITFDILNKNNRYIGNIDTKNKSPIYLSINETNEYINNGNLTAFCLQRLKLNFIIYYKTYDNKYGLFNAPSELVDVSIMKQYSNDLKKIYENIEYEFANYIYTSNNNLQIQFKSYSLYGHISDLSLVLFIQSPKPWINPKYEKRINRLMYFIILELFSIGDITKTIYILLILEKIFNSTTNLDNKNKYFDKLKDEINNLKIKKINLGIDKLIKYYQPIINKYYNSNNSLNSDFKNMYKLNKIIYDFINKIINSNEYKFLNTLSVLSDNKNNNININLLG